MRVRQFEMKTKETAWWIYKVSQLVCRKEKSWEQAYFLLLLLFPPPTSNQMVTL